MTTNNTPHFFTTSGDPTNGTTSTKSSSKSLFFQKSIPGESIKWKLISRREIAPRSAHASCGIPGTPLLFVFGGTNNKYCEPLSEQYFSVYDYDKLTWKHYDLNYTSSSSTSSTSTSSNQSNSGSSGHDDQNRLADAENSIISPRIGHSMIGVTDGKIIGSQVLGRMDIVLQQHAQIRHSALLVFGGWTNGSSVSSELWKFNVTSGTWHNLTRVQSGSVPSARSNHACVVIGDQMIVFGGMGQEGDDLLGDTHILDLNTLNWTSVSMDGTEGVDYPFKSRCHACAVHRKRMILFGGGSDKVCYNTLWSFDLLVRRWMKIDVQEPRLTRELKRRQMERIQSHVQSLDWFNELSIPPSAVFSEPEPRLFCSGAIVEMDQLFVFGGRNGKQKINETWRFDFECNEWSLIQFGDMSEIDQILAPDPEEESEEQLVMSQHTMDGRNQVKPAPRSSCSMSTVTKSDGTTRILMFGGAKSNEKSSELWELQVQLNQTRNNLFKVFERGMFSDIEVITQGNNRSP